MQWPDLPSTSNTAPGLRAAHLPQEVRVTAVTALSLPAATANHQLPQRATASALLFHTRTGSGYFRRSAHTQMLPIREAFPLNPRTEARCPAAQRGTGHAALPAVTQAALPEADNDRHTTRHRPESTAAAPRPSARCSAAARDHRATAGRPRARRGYSSGRCRPPPLPNPSSGRPRPRRAERRPSLRPAEGGRRAALTLRAGADLRHRFLHRRHRRRAWGGGTAALHLPPSSPPVGAPRREPGPGLRSATGLRRRRQRARASLRSRRRSFPTVATPARLTRRPLRNLLTPPRLPPPPLPAVLHRRLPPPRGRPLHVPKRAAAQPVTSRPFLRRV